MPRVHVERTIVGGQVSIAEHAKAAAGAATVEACGVCRCPLREVDAHVSLRHGHGRTRHKPCNNSAAVQKAFDFRAAW